MFSFRELLSNFDFNVMFVHLIKKDTIINYAKFNTRSAIPIEDWLQKLNSADWQNPGDIKRTYNSADLLGKSNHKVIFDLGGNNYRMICKYAFGREQVHLFICWIGTHAEYDVVCKELKQYTVNIYKMETLKYTVIKNQEQYSVYCDLLESLIDMEEKYVNTEDEIDLLTLLIEKYDEEHHTFNEVDPIRLLRSFMEDHHLTATALSELLQVSKGYVSDILNYKKGLSKEVIRKLSEHFKVKQEAFNRTYPLKSAIQERLIHAG